MDFKDTIKQLADRITKHKELVQTEEATKHSFVMPFIQALGYDVFNPMEVIPEFIADIGIKKGEKVDYAIVKDGHPIILIECKHWSADLNPHNSQLFRYFHTTKAKFSILTNGFESRFYTDLTESNKMDEKPFFVFDIRDIKDNQLEELKKFHKSYFDHATIVSTANELKYTSELKALINEEVNNPSTEFVKYFAKQVHPGVITPVKLDFFQQLMKRSFQQYINDLITVRLKSALKQEDETRVEITSEPIAETVKPLVETTQDEMDAFYIVRAILRKKLDSKRITYRDAQSYFAILLDDNNRKPICRLNLNLKKKSISLFSSVTREEIKSEITSIDDIYTHADALISTLDFYMKAKAEPVS